MKKQSPLFKVGEPSDPPQLIHKNPKMGNLWAVYVDKKPHWIVEINGLSYTYPVHPKEPESYLVHIVEEAAHRLRDVVTLKIDPSRVKGLQIVAGSTSDDLAPYVAHLDDWYRGDQHWVDDLEWQKRLAR